jgi:hypothetical protein
MCDKCSTINRTIERFRQIRRSISTHCRTGKTGHSRIGRAKGRASFRRLRANHRHNELVNRQRDLGGQFSRSTKFTRNVGPKANCRQRAYLHRRPGCRFDPRCHCSMSNAIALPYLQQFKKDNIMSRRENDANNTSRPSDRPLTEYEKEQVALRRNLQRLKAERLAKEAANSKGD